jgi:hypothetical protein
MTGSCNMPTLCDRCGERRATGQSSTTTVTLDGTQTNVTESLCAVCSAAEQRAYELQAEAIQAQMNAELADGSLYERLRSEIPAMVQAGDPEQLANAAVYLDRMREALGGVPFPEDLERFANQHRPPAA